MLRLVVAAFVSCTPDRGAATPDVPAWEASVVGDSQIPSGDTADSVTPDSSPGDSGSSTDSADTGSTLPFHYVTTPDLRIAAYGSSGEFGEHVDGGDFNGDGVPDLAVYSKADGWGGRAVGAVFVYFGPLAGTRVAESADATVFGGGTESILGMEVLADLDGDGGDELRVGTGDTSRLLLSSAVSVGGTVALSTGVVLAWSTLDPSATWDDVDSDGVPEVVATEPDFSVYDGMEFACGQLRLLDGADLLLGIETPLVDTARRYTDYDALGGTIVFVDDRDGDGLREIATNDDSGSVVLSSQALLADEFAVIQDIEAELLAAAGDADGDGLDDILVRTAGELSVVTAAVGETVEAASLVTLMATDGGTGSARALGDPDADGDDDFALAILASDGYHVTRVDTAEVVIGGSFALSGRGLDVGPFDADHLAGAPDGTLWVASEESGPWARVVSAIAFGTVTTSLDDARASVRAEGPYLRVYADYTNWVDVDGDGRPELILQASYPAGWAVVPGSVVAAGGEWGACDAGCFATSGFTGVLDDLDGDGQVEVYVAGDDTVTRFPLVHLLTGAESPVGVYSGASLLSSFTWLGAGDVNGDGLPDPAGSSFVADGSKLLASFDAETLLANIGSDARFLGDLDGDGKSELSSARGLFAGADLYGGTTYNDLEPLFEYTADIQDPDTTPADADADGAADTPLAFDGACGWVSGLPSDGVDATDLVAGASGVGSCDGIWLVPGASPQWLVAAYREPGRELRVWRFEGARLYAPDEARIAIDLAGVETLRVRVDPVDEAGLGILVGRLDGVTLTESLELYRFP